MASKRKKSTAIVAGVTALALLLGGTFAWTSISQQAKNEAIVDINPGGRLHDDFNGTNKDVYVENFGDDITGVPIFARIRLDQYFEVGQEAGKNKTAGMADRNVEAKIGTDINDVTTWVPYIPGEGDLTDTSKVPANDNWQWALGNDDSNKPIYLPTFNMNKDSLAADINGTYEGTVEGDIVHYDDYKNYKDGEAITGTEVHDWDSNADEEEEGTTAEGFPAYSTTNPNAPIDDAHVYLKSTDEDGTPLTHTTKPISSTATVMTMAEWIAQGSQPGPYWVYDTDGWAYWAQPIAPGQTTGLLLDSISMSKVPDDNYYYGINVVGQFATKGDIYQFEDMSPEAEVLFAKVTESEEIVISGADTINIGEPATFTATRNIFGETADAQPTFTWTATATDADGQAIEGISIADGVLTTESTVPHGTQITVTATAGNSTATLAEGDEAATETSTPSASMTVTALGNVQITATNGLTEYEPGTAASETFTAQVNGGSTDVGTLTWTVTDGEGNTLTHTTFNEGTLNIGESETALKIIVTAIYTSTDGEIEFSGTYEILQETEVSITDEMTAGAYGILTDDGSGNGTYVLTIIRSEREITTSNTYQDQAIANVYAGIESGSYNWGEYQNKITSVRVANTFKPKTLENLCYNMTSLKTVDFSKMDTTDVTSMKHMFRNTTSLETVDLSGLEFAETNAVDVSGLFWYSSVSSVKLPEKLKVSNMANTFEDCRSLKTVPEIKNWDVSEVTSFAQCFLGCSALETVDLSGWTTVGSGNFTDMFKDCYGLRSVNLSNIQLKDGAVANFTTMFNMCRSLSTVTMPSDITVSSMKSMFYACQGLTTVNGAKNWKFSANATLESAFQMCMQLRSLAGATTWDTSAVTNMKAMFHSCSGLALNCSNWDVSNVTSYDNFAQYAYNLTLPTAWQTTTTE